MSTLGFRAARGIGRPGIGNLWATLVVVGAATLGVFGSLAVYGRTDGFELGTPVAITWVVVASGILLPGVLALVRSRTTWARAERGEATLTFAGEAVATQRIVSGRPMRTVVVRHDSVVRYVHLLFPGEPVARRVAAGPVRLDLFGGSKVHGPARLTLPDGDILWAFASKMGKAVDLPADAPSDAPTNNEVGPLGRLLRRWYRRDDDDRRGDDDWSGDSGDGWSGGGSWGSGSGSSGSGGGSSWGGSAGDSGGASSSD